MADTSFAFTDPRAQTVWSKHLFDYCMPNIMLSPLMGQSSNDFIHVDKDLTKKAGGTIVFKARERLTGAGVGDDGDTTNNAQQIKRRNMSMTIHERATRTQSAGKLSEQLTDSKFREDSKLELGDWITEIIENDLVTGAAGLYNENSSSGSIETINESYPSSARIFFGGQNADGTLGNSGTSYADDAALTAGTQANNLCGTKLLELIKRKAITAQPRFAGGMVKDLSKATPKDIRTGKGLPSAGRFFFVFLHPLQIKAVKAETGTTGWKAMTAEAQERGNINPIFSGAAFLWDGMIVWEYDRVPTRTGAGGTLLAEGFLLNAGRTATTDACASGRSVARGMLFGANALCFGWAQFPGWYEDYYDVNKPIVKTDMLYGVKRTVFNAHGTSTPGQDEAIYCFDTEVITD
jgi:N4-gp56 family major capsid protein